MKDGVVRRIHITGGAGSGKTWLASRIARELGIPHHDLDGIGIARESAMDDRSDVPALLRTLARDVDEIAEGDAWVTDGSFLGWWTQPLFERADLVVLLDVPWRVAAYRILVRHVKAEMARNNRFPGWRRLGRFWLYSRRFYRDANPEGVNPYGNPRNRSYLLENLAAYREKLVVCRTKGETDALIARLQGEMTNS